MFSLSVWIPYVMSDSLVHFFLFTMLLQIQFMPSCREKMKVKLYQWQSLMIKRTAVQEKKPTLQQFGLIFSEWLYSRRVGNAPIWLISFCLRRNQLIKVGTRPDLNSLPRHSWAGLNLPLTIPICMQVESLGDLAGWWRCGQILLIGKDEHWNAF